MTVATRARVKLSGRKRERAMARLDLHPRQKGNGFI
jgi:hypothetical protein